MALKSAQDQGKGEDIEELLDVLDKTLDRLKVLYEQYFLGMQKQAPAYLHTDVERKLRDLAQINIRNTGLRYRYATLQQKFGSYNSYWRRTLRQIENGTYIRNLSKIGRQAARTGEDIPEEILAAMPKRMREQVLRDRDAAIAAAARRKGAQVSAEDGAVDVDMMFAEEPGDDEEAPAIIGESLPTEMRRELKTSTGAHVVKDDDDFDIDAFFASVEQEKEPATGAAPKATGPRASGLEPREPEPVRQLPRAASQPGVPTGRASQPAIQTQPIPRAPTEPGAPVGRQSQPAIPTQPPQRQSQPVIPRAATQPGEAPQRQSQPVIPRAATQPGEASQRQSQPVIPTQPPQRQSQPVIPTPTGAIPKPGTGAVPRAPSQAIKPNPIAPGSAAAKGPVEVEQMTGPFPRAPRPEQPKPPPATQRLPRTDPGPPQKPPPGMSDADVNALYAKYVQAKQMLGENVGTGGKDKLLKTINAQAPKIMEQYKAKAVDFSVVVKDNQVIIKAKPKL